MRALLLWLLMLAQPIYGGSSASLRLLGPAHWHAGPAAAAPGDDWLQPALQVVKRLADRVQQIHDEAHLRAHAYGHKHEHHGLQRHWHDAADGSVHTVGSADPAVADLVAGASVGSATLTLAAPALPLVLPVSRANGRWPSGAAPAWADAEPRNTRPPPRR
jgi:hypothetical protein